MSHNERCKVCKIRVRELLEKIYGPVIMNYRIPLGTKPENLREHPRYPILNEIFASLQQHRGYTEFVRASYVDVDFFLPEQRMIVEFDESQHFTEPRKIALSQYPSDLKIGFSREAWMKHCDEIHAHDNDPPFRDKTCQCRDEQRAWYDALRDFIPESKGFRPTVRLFSREMEWCSLNPENPDDLLKFRAHLEKQNEIDLKIRTDANPQIARIIISGPWNGDVSQAGNILDAVAQNWGSHPSTEFLITTGAFLRFKWPESHPPVGNVIHPNIEAVNALREVANSDIDSLLTSERKSRLAKHTRYLTIGIDSRNGLYQIEFVCVVDLQTNVRKWTGKSYPDTRQERQLIRITDLSSHFLQLNNRSVLVLGCHDLHIFNNRWGSRESMLSKWRIESRSEMLQLSEIQQPTVVLQHPHSADSCGTWRMGWSGLVEKIKSVKIFASAGLYYNDGNPCRNSLNEILQATKKGDTLDFIILFEKCEPKKKLVALPTTIEPIPDKRDDQQKLFFKVADIFEPIQLMIPDFNWVRKRHNQFTFSFTEWREKISQKGMRVHYEFDHDVKSRQISVEFQCKTDNCLPLFHVIEKMMPDVRRKMSGNPRFDTLHKYDWHRIQFFYDESTDPKILAESLRILVEETREQVHDWIKKLPEVTP